MERPKISAYNHPKHIRDYPVGPCYKAGNIVEVNSTWRTFTPNIDNERCVHCLKCYLCCPEGVIYEENEEIKIDYDFCKGCGICAKECKLNAINMFGKE